MNNIGFLLIQVFLRSAAVDSAGCEFNRNRLIALMSAIVLEEVSVPCSQKSFSLLLQTLS